MLDYNEQRLHESLGDLAPPSTENNSAAVLLSKCLLDGGACPCALVDLGKGVGDDHRSCPTRGDTRLLEMYRGTLWFEDGDEIVVNALIPHGDRISFDFTATWGEHGQW